MSRRVKLKITKAEDRDLMAAIMVRNGYGVRPAKMEADRQQKLAVRLGDLRHPGSGGH